MIRSIFKSEKKVKWREKCQKMDSEDAENVQTHSCGGYGYINTKLHSIFSVLSITLNAHIVLIVVQSCSGDVQHQSSHIHLLAIESILITDVCNASLSIKVG